MYCIIVGSFLVGNVFGNFSCVFWMNNIRSCLVSMAWWSSICSIAAVIMDSEEGFNSWIPVILLVVGWICIILIFRTERVRKHFRVGDHPFYLPSATDVKEILIVIINYVCYCKKPKSEKEFKIAGTDAEEYVLPTINKVDEIKFQKF